MNRRRILFLTQGAAVAAMYVALTYVSQIFGLASGVIQLRLSEALTVLPYFTPAAIPGLFIGCLLANLLTGCAIWDIVFGSFATLFAAILCRLLCHRAWNVTIPNIILNTAIIPFVLRLVYNLPDSIAYLFLTVGIGELISCGVLGTLMFFAISKSPLMKTVGFEIKTHN